MAREEGSNWQKFTSGNWSNICSLSLKGPHEVLQLSYTFGPIFFNENNIIQNVFNFLRLYPRSQPTILPSFGIKVSLERIPTKKSVLEYQTYVGIPTTYILSEYSSAHFINLVCFWHEWNNERENCGGKKTEQKGFDDSPKAFYCSQNKRTYWVDNFCQN